MHYGIEKSSTSCVKLSMALFVKQGLQHQARNGQTIAKQVIESRKARRPDSPSVRRRRQHLAQAV